MPRTVALGIELQIIQLYTLSHCSNMDGFTTRSHQISCPIEQVNKSDSLVKERKSENMIILF